VCCASKINLNEKKFGGGLWRWSWQLIVHELKNQTPKNIGPHRKSWEPTQL
jgi:hypothetical protein